MEFKFDSKQDFQNEAINSTVKLFESVSFRDIINLGIYDRGIIPNKNNLNEEQILKRLQHIQNENKLVVSDNLESMNFSIEMETGTGKTYVYLRTIFELHKKCGFKKFMIIVPSIAIREGVIKNLESTKKHFKTIYDNISYNYYEYNSKKIKTVKNFSRSNNIEIMIITLVSFTKDTNIMNQKQDNLNGESPINLISKTRPILILDEPQNMESVNAKHALVKLNPLFTLRYSATHKEYYNLIYRLLPNVASVKNLVKKIEISSVTEDNNFNDVFIRCVDTMVVSKKIKAKLEIYKKTKNGIKAKEITVINGDDLFEKTKNHQYDGLRISDISVRDGDKFIKFSNGIKIISGQEQGNNKEEVMKQQICHTIDIHFKNHFKLKKEGIKQLSLFFIDKVDNYESKDGFIKKTFDEYFEQEKKNHPDFINLDANKVRSEYFSKQKTDGAMQEKFKLIMRDKERLLSFSEPVQFIFSHSALKEGWDNPNVFNICTLNQTVSEMKKRQEIGRGLRLPVNQEGDRLVNNSYTLTVIPNEAYEKYVRLLQQEYVDKNSMPSIVNKNKKHTIKLKNNFKLDPTFVKLWEKISQKTRYDVKINTTELIKKCVKELDKISTNPIYIKIVTGSIVIEKGGEIEYTMIGDKFKKTNKKFKITNIIENISKETHLTRNTIIKILTKTKGLNYIFNNPHVFTESCITIIQKNLEQLLLNKIKYEKIDDWYSMQLFEDDLEAHEPLFLKVNKSIYDGLKLESMIEKDFAERMDKHFNEVKLFIKLPPKFIVPTPIGNYNPDWAIAMDNTNALGQVQEMLYFVTETKGSTDENQLRGSELKKIKYGEKHFKTMAVKYALVANIEDLINLKQNMNKQVKIG